VLTATNLAGAWDPPGPNAFDADGNFACTNPFLSAIHAILPVTVGNLPELPSRQPITSQPQNRTVGEDRMPRSPSAPAAPRRCRYQWYSVPDALLAGKTTPPSPLRVTTNQSGGGYFVIVANPVGTGHRSVASLTVTSTPPTAPAITTQPQNQQVNEARPPPSPGGHRHAAAVLPVVFHHQRRLGRCHQRDADIASASSQQCAVIPSS